jgi:acyl carrier protein
MGSSIDGRVVEVISKQLGVETTTIKRESRIVEDLDADSLDRVELVMELEEEFDLETVSDEDAQRLLTVGNIVDYITKKLAKQSQPS